MARVYIFIHCLNLKKKIVKLLIDMKANLKMELRQTETCSMPMAIITGATLTNKDEKSKEY